MSAKLKGLGGLSDRKVRATLRHLETLTLASSKHRAELGHLLRAANWIVSKRPDAIAFGPVDRSKESAHFDATREEIILDETMRLLPLGLSAGVLCHELQHAYDEMSGRPYTFEAELRAFKAEVIFLGWLDPGKVAGQVRDANGWHWFGYIYRKRLEFLKSEMEFESSALYDFVKSYLGESKFEGLQTVEKTLLDVRTSLEHKRHERGEALGLLRAKNLRARDKKNLNSRLLILDADLSIGKRIESSLQKERALVLRGNPLCVDG